MKYGEVKKVAYLAGYADGKADGIAQGRREAAEAYCSGCSAGMFDGICSKEACSTRNRILGTASKEKEEKT